MRKYPYLRATCNGMYFDILASDSASHARTGTLHTPHGEVATPIFMPVGTLGGVKCETHRDLRNDTLAQIVLGNTYHLFLRPGIAVIRAAGGLHAFSSWRGPMLTDSGGFQVFSLAKQRKLSPLGAHFQSHINGSPHLFTPERVVNIQRILGSDIVMPLDECPPGDAPRDYAEQSLALTLNWLKRCHAQMARTSPLYGHRQSLFPIVQGASFLDLREKSAECAANLNADGYAIGGLAVGEPTETMYAVVEHLHRFLPTSRPRYLMGVGTPWNILEAIARGVDMFDCVMPTRNARNGMIFTSNGVLNMRNIKWRNDHSPLDPSGTSHVDQSYSRAYLRHLFVANEALAAQIATLHNLAFYLHLVACARMHICDGSFLPWKNQMVKRLATRL